MNKSQRILCLIALFTGSASLAMDHLKGPEATKDGYSCEMIGTVATLALVLVGLAHFWVF